MVLEISVAQVDETLHHRLEGLQLYLLWNFGTTLIWCLQVTLTVLARAEEGENWQDSHLVLFELILAIYFASDSIRLCRRWKRASGDLEGELFDAVLSAVGYFCLLVKSETFRRLLWRKRHEHYELIL